MDGKYNCQMIFLIIFVLNGITLILVETLINLFNYFNQGKVNTLKLAIEYLGFTFGCMVLMSLSFKKIAFLIE